MNKISLPLPSQQVEFARRLKEIREEYLQEALLSIDIPIKQLNDDLELYADAEGLAILRKHGLRGELLFAVPTVLEKHPKLLGYYRLLLGYSQKEFYTRTTGASRFKSMEFEGAISKHNQADISKLCIALNEQSLFLLNNIDNIGKSLLDDLTILTLGPQLRGGTNNRIGQKAIKTVFEILYNIVKKQVIAEQTTNTVIVLKNSSGRLVHIRFASDPDIVIEEETGTKPRLILAIEIKGGKDYSNIHNRIGEAEKSHQKARNKGFTNCWTIVNTQNWDENKARKESPTTNKFFRLTKLEKSQSDEYREFRREMILLIGIPLLSATAKKKTKRRPS